MHRNLLLLGTTLLFNFFPAQASVLFFSGDLRTDANITSCGTGCTLDSSNTDADYAQFAAYITSFDLSSDSTVQIITYSFGGGSSLTGANVAPGGFEPYLSLFDAAGNFLSSTYFATTCPAGANTFGGHCYDVELDAGLLPAATYQVAISAWGNLSLAENYGSGNLSDGFAGLGQLNGREGLAYAFDVVISPESTVPEPATWLLALSMLGVVVKYRRWLASGAKPIY